MFGYYTKKNDNDFVVKIELNSYGSGYNVVPKFIDPWNAYDIAEVQAYVHENPEMEVEWSEKQQKYITVQDPVEV